MSRERSAGLPPWARALVWALTPGAFSAEITRDLEEGFRARIPAGRLRARLWLLGQLARLRPLELRRAARLRLRLDAGDAAPARAGRSSRAGRGGWHTDLAAAARGLRARPLFAATVVGTVALAVGVTTAVFSVVNGVLLRPLPYPESDRLVLAWQTRPEWESHPNAQLALFARRFPLSAPTFFDWSSAPTGLEAMGIYSNASWIWQSSESVELVRGLEVTSGIFRSLGVDPILGRAFVTEDDLPGAEPVVVLSHRSWRDRFGSDPDVVGRAVSLDGRPHVVVGVMPSGFALPGHEPEMWATLDPQRREERGTQNYTVLGRMRPGATPESVQAELVAIQERLALSYPAEQADMRAVVRGLLEETVEDVSGTLLLLLGAVGLVLTIACVNIANMLSVSGLARARELAVRAALGASRARLVGALLSESALLAGAGGVLGVLIASAALPMLVDALPDSLPRAEDVTVDPFVLGFGLGVTALTALVVGSLPALQALRTDPRPAIEASARGTTGGRTTQRVRSGLVVAQVSLAFVLLVGAGLLGTSFHRLWTVDRGFDSEGLVALSLLPGVEREQETDRGAREARADDIRRALEAIPGVAVARTNQIPLSGSSSTTTYHVPRDDGLEEVGVMISVVDESYLDVLGAVLVEGRGFDGSEVRDAPLVALANRTLVEQLWPGESGVGKELREREEAPPTTIVGVVADVRHNTLQRGAEAKLYVPTSQDRRGADQWLLRVQGDPGPVVDAARDAVAVASPSTAVRSAEILDDRIARSVAVPRFRALSVVGLALLATLLSLIGVYGVVAFAVSQRLRELAVRVALGARPDALVARTVSGGLRLSLAGVALGALVSWRLASLGVLQEFLFEVRAVDPLTWISVAVAVVAVGAGAAWVPARRAARVDPVTILKAD